MIFLSCVFHFVPIWPKCDILVPILVALYIIWLAHYLSEFFIILVGANIVGLLLDNRTYPFNLLFVWLLIYYLNSCKKVSNEGRFFLINKVLTLFPRSYLLEDDNDRRLQFHPLTILVWDSGGIEKDYMLEEWIIQRCVWKL
jgi:hypothetical protein